MCIAISQLYDNIKLELTEFNNYCLPNQSEDSEYYNPKADSSVEHQYVNIVLGAKQEERFAVVLFYNHTKFVSEELVFTNLTKIPDAVTTDINGALYIEHYNNKSQNSY